MKSVDVKGETVKSIETKLPGIFKYILLAGAGLYVVIYLWMVYHRIQYPFELEWIEGGMVDEVRWIVSGKGAYTAPDIDYVPFLYPPVYFYLSALVSKIFGANLFSLRLVSLVSSLVSFSVIFLIVRDETKNSFAAFLSTCLFAATYRLTGAWLDIARVDSLFLAFLLLFLYFVLHKNSPFSYLIAGVLASLAILTKQTALIICLPVIAYALYKDWRRSISLPISVVAILGGTTLVMNRVSGGWYTYYVFELLQQQTQWITSVFLSFWTHDLLLHLPVAICLTALFLGKRLHERDYSGALKWGLILIGALAGAYLTRAKKGGYDNVLLPAYATLAILFGLGLNEFFKKTIKLDGVRKAILETGIYIVCIIQLAIPAYNPFAQIPTKADQGAGYELAELLSKTPGEVYLVYHGYVPSLAGKRTYAHFSAILDIMKGERQNRGEKLLRTKIRKAMREQTFEIIILDGERSLLPGLDIYYENAGEVFQENEAFFPVTGLRTRPTYIYVPRRSIP